MERDIDISATIVVYKEAAKTLQKTIASFLNVSLRKKLYIIDNSPSNTLKEFCDFPEVEYVFVGQNKGFGSGHNLVLDNIKNYSRYHLILNPDVIFEPNVLLKLIKELETNQDVAMVSPKVMYPNGKQQYTCRRTPTLLELFYRRVGLRKKFTALQEYRDQELEKSFYPDFIHGCFMLFKTQDFINLKGFDEQYFLYMEDADICRKIKVAGKKVMYYPSVQITHIHRRGSAKNSALLYYHIVSAVKYFKKWNK